MILEPGGAVTPVHDPVMIKEGDQHYVFATGLGVSIFCSPDMQSWSLCGRAFSTYPAWVLDSIPDVRQLWAPDIVFHAGTYYLYYAASTFGSNRSAIGLATNVTLDPDSPDYAWVDQGQVIASEPGDDYNAIDPHLAFDADGQPWLAFGSFWSGIKLVKIDPQTFKPAPGSDLIAIASRPGSTAIEGPFIVRRGEHYYLFVSHDFCCRGVESTYRIMVGRAPAITGPYVDREGRALTEGGGTLLYSGSERWRGPGHNSIFVDQDTYWMVYHAYDAQNIGTPTLRTEALIWDAEGWPVSPSALLGK